MAARHRPASAAPPDPQVPLVRPAAPTGGLVLQRARLHALIDARLPGAVWLHGPTGAGKTLLLRSYLRRDGRAVLWLSADERHSDPAALFAALTAMAGEHCAGHLPAFSPEHREQPAAFAPGYFARLDQMLPPEFALVVDDAHHLVGTTAPLLASAVDAFGGRRKLCFASQLMPDASFAPQLAGSRLWIVGHRQLAFDHAEARELATQLGARATALDALVAATDGWAAGLMLAMQFGASGGSDNGSSDPLEAVRTPLALLIAGQVLGGVEQDDLARLRLLAELPQVPMELADLAPDWAPACARLQALSERGLFVERLSADRGLSTIDVAPGNAARLPKGSWRLHDLFRNALREPGAIGTPYRPLGEVLVDRLLALEQLDLAWRLAARLGAEPLSKLVASHGGRALRDPQLLAMLQMAEPHANRANPVVAAWSARGLIGNDNDAALRSCTEAFEGFDACGERDGASLASSLALFIVFATIENVGEVATWARRLERADQRSVDDLPSGEHAAIRIAGEVVHDLLVGGRSTDDQRRGELQDRLMVHVAGEVLCANETILAGSLLVAAMRRTIRLQEVELAIVRVEGLACYRHAAPHIRASWDIENGFHFLRVGLPKRARDAFDSAMVVADENALLQPKIGALIGLARLELGLGDVRRARQLIESLEALGQDRLGRQRGWVQHLHARVHALTGRPDLALSCLDRADRLISEAGFPRTTKVILDQDRIQMLYASGDVAKCLALAGRLSAVGAEGDARRLGIASGLLEAHALRDSDRPRADALLETHLRSARLLNLMTFLPLLPGVVADIAAEGLVAGVEVDFLERSIRLRNLPAPAGAPARWPWAVRVEVLRPFRVLLCNEPLTFTGKVQQKPLELLKYLCCNRNLVAESSALAIALWPDVEEGAARKSLEVTVSRLRKLLLDDSLVIVREGKVSLDASRVCSDAKTFFEATLEAESVAGGRLAPARVAAVGEKLLTLLHELPLEHDEPGTWREGVRERYRTAFVRAVRALATYWVDAGDGARAITLIEAGLAREPLAEGLYRSLMQLHLDAGRHTEAMRVYRQCRQMLSVLIGTQPGNETERLKALIKL